MEMRRRDILIFESSNKIRQEKLGSRGFGRVESAVARSSGTVEQSSQMQVARWRRVPERRAQRFYLKILFG